MEPISTQWLPINSKDAYKFYLEADRIANGIKSPTLRKKIINGLIGFIWRYLRLLRKAEYYHNCKTSPACEAYLAYLKLRMLHYELKLGFNIPLNVAGPGLRLIHYGAISINEGARLGANCTLFNLVSIAGNKSSFIADGFPTIGDDVVISPGTHILGNITVADGIVIGANSVVTKSFLEPNITIAGSPARKISEHGVDTFFGPQWVGNAVRHYLATHKDQFTEQ